MTTGIRSDASGTFGALTFGGDAVLNFYPSGKVHFPVLGSRITGDFSNATVANRVMFQTSTVNGPTSLHTLPNGTSMVSQFTAETSSTDPSNASFAQLRAEGGVQVALASESRGTGTYLPMTFYTSGTERMRIDTSGNVMVTSPAGLGYGPGAGGTVTQATHKSTAVTLNKPCGQITMHTSVLAAGADVSFTLNNSLVTLTDIVVASTVTLTNYRVEARINAAGQVGIRVTNVSTGSLYEVLKINFAIIKGATA